MTVALEAAHIKWHQAGGPAVESNGLALCSLHHKLLDHGAFTVSEECRILVSQDATGSSGMREQLLRYHGEKIQPPQSSEYMPRAEYLVWHRREVFKGIARTLDNL